MGDWRFVFLQAVPLDAIAAVLVWYGLPQDPPRYERLRQFDWRGALLILVGAGSLATLMLHGDQYDWFNSPTICGAAVDAIRNVGERWLGHRAECRSSGRRSRLKARRR